MSPTAMRLAGVCAASMPALVRKKVLRSIGFISLWSVRRGHLFISDKLSLSNRRVIMRVLLAVVFPALLSAQERLPGTDAFTIDGDLAARMVDGINTYLARET